MEGLELEAGFVWEGWSVNDALVVEGVNFLVDTTISPVEVAADVALPAGFRDAWSARFGGEYQLNDALALRAGGYYETSAVPTSALGLGQVDMDKVGYGSGVSWAVNSSLQVDLSVGQIFFASADVTDSETEGVMVNAISGEVEEEGVIVGNGVYTSSIVMGGIGLSWAFGN